MTRFPLLLNWTAVLVSLDQVSKASAPTLERLAAGQFKAVHNDALVLGTPGPRQAWVLLLSTVLLVIFGTFAVRQAQRGLLPIAVPALLIGGAVGNLVDRLRLGVVQDFILLPGGVVANLADFFVYVGLTLYVTAALAHRGTPLAGERPLEAR